jgi:hypothetical protein
MLGYSQPYTGLSFSYPIYPYLSIVLFPPLSDGQNLSYILSLLTLKTFYIPTLSLFLGQLRGGMGNVAWLGPPSSPFPCMGTWDRGQFVQMTFIIMPALLPLSNYLQGCDGKFSLLGSPLLFVLTNAKVKMRDIGKPYRCHFDNYLNVPSLSPLIIQYGTYLVTCPCPVVASCAYSPYLGPSKILMFLLFFYYPASYGSLGKRRLSG